MGDEATLTARTLEFLLRGREWDEREHRVTVNAHGQFEYEGQGFKSLTAVARHITGTHWSGPAFFGLTKGAQ